MYQFDGCTLTVWIRQKTIKSNNSNREQCEITTNDRVPVNSKRNANYNVNLKLRIIINMYMLKVYFIFIYIFISCQMDSLP